MPTSSSRPATAAFPRGAVAGAAPLRVLPDDGAATLSSPGQGTALRAGGPRTSARRVTPQRPPASAVGGKALAGGTSGNHARTWVLELPAGLKLLSLNQRLHWAEVNRRSRELKKAAWVMALKAKVPHLEHGLVVLEYQPPDRRERDEDNLSATAKPCTDGLMAAGVFTDDSSSYVTFGGCRIGELYPEGRVVLHITEVTP